MYNFSFLFVFKFLFNERFGITLSVRFCTICRIQNFFFNKRFCITVLFVLKFGTNASAYRLCITVSVHFFVSVRIPILNMFCSCLSEMASSSTPVNSIPNHGEKPEKFNGTDFKRWQQKMLFCLTTLNLVRFHNKDGPKLDIGETYKEKLAAVDAWNHSDFLCRNYVPNGLENTLYKVYSPLK